MSQEMSPHPIPPMDYETFARLWANPVPDKDRNWYPDLATYRDAYLYLMGLPGPQGTRRPNFARLAIPPLLQPLLVALFMEGHQVFVEPSPSRERVIMTIWRPPHPDEEPRPGTAPNDLSPA